jgi:PhnB protein
MLNITPYLNFMGTTEEAMTFYKSVLGGEFTTFSRFKDLPGGERMSKEEQMKLMHVALDLGNGRIIMATDALESMGQQVEHGNNYHIVLHTESEAETDRIFDGLSKGGKIEMPLNKTFWGAYFGMFRDKFGVQWMINYVPEQK